MNGLIALRRTDRSIDWRLYGFTIFCLIIKCVMIEMCVPWIKALALHIVRRKCTGIDSAQSMDWMAALAGIVQKRGTLPLLSHCHWSFALIVLESIIPSCTVVQWSVCKNNGWLFFQFGFFSIFLSSFIFWCAPKPIPSHSSSEPQGISQKTAQYFCILYWKLFTIDWILCIVYTVCGSEYQVGCHGATDRLSNSFFCEIKFMNNSQLHFGHKIAATYLPSLLSQLQYRSAVTVNLL